MTAVELEGAVFRIPGELRAVLAMRLVDGDGRDAVSASTRLRLAAAPTEPAYWVVQGPFGMAAWGSTPEIAAIGAGSPADAVPLWVHPPVPDGETARLRAEVARLREWIDTEGRNCPSWATIDAVLSVADTTGDEAKCESCGLRPALCLCNGRPAGVSSSTPGPAMCDSCGATVAEPVWTADGGAFCLSCSTPDPELIDALLPAEGDERDALVEVMQDAIFESFDIDSGAKEYAIAAFEALRDTLRDTPVGGTPANTTEEQG